jgi:hypothetical protein
MSTQALTISEAFEKRAGVIKAELTKNGGKLPAATEENKKSREQYRSHILTDMKDAQLQLDSMRQGADNRPPVNMHFSDYVRERWGFSPEKEGDMSSFFKFLGVNPATNTLGFLASMTDYNEGYRFLIPEVIREAVRLGLRKAPLWTNLVADEVFVDQPSIKMPYINPSDAKPTKIGESETIPTGRLSFGQREVSLQKIGTGLKLTSEVQRYVKLNQLSIYFTDMGNQLNMAQDVMLIDILINGDGNSNAAPVIGVNSTTDGITYKDLLRAWIRMSTLGRMPQSILSNENIALDVLSLPEFTNNTLLLAGIESNLKRINLRTPVPTNQAYDVHGAMPVDNQLMLIDNTSAAIKFTSDALRIESDRIAEKQIDAVYATLTTGFACLFRDARVIIDASQAYSGAPFPTWMDAGAVQAAASLNSL